MRVWCKAAASDCLWWETDPHRKLVIPPLYLTRMHTHTHTHTHTHLEQYEKLVEQSLDLEGIDNHEYRINPRYNADLQVFSQADLRQASIYSKRTHSIVREHILQSENTFCSLRTHSIVRERILYIPLLICARPATSCVQGGLYR